MFGIKSFRRVYLRTKSATLTGRLLVPEIKRGRNGITYN